jgi:hypothetical protein
MWYSTATLGGLSPEELDRKLNCTLCLAFSKLKTRAKLWRFKTLKSEDVY